jgi:hypothetical protein
VRTGIRDPSSEPFPVTVRPSRSSCGAAVLVMQENEGGRGDRADAPGTEPDPAQRLERGLEQRVAAFGRGPGGRVQQVDGALVLSQPPTGRMLDPRGQRAPLAFIAQIGQDGVIGVGPLSQER